MTKHYARHEIVNVYRGVLVVFDRSSDVQPGPAAPVAESVPSSPSGLGNTNAMKTGARSARVLAGLMPEQREAREALAERRASIVAGLGGADALSPLALGQVERHARLELVDEYLWANLQTFGVLTGKGRQRAALTAWLAVVDRLQKSAMTLGLDRKQRQINPLDMVRRAVEEANKP